MELREEPEGRSWISALPPLFALTPASGMRDAPLWLVWLLAAIVLLSWTGVDRLLTGPDALFDPFGASGLAWYVLVLLAAAAMLASQSRPRVLLRSALALLLLLTVVLLALTALAIAASIPRIALLPAALVVALYCTLVAARMLQSMTGRAQPRAVTSAMLALAATWWFAGQFYVDPGLWYSPDLDAYAEDAKAVEGNDSLLFEQPARIDAAIARVAQADGGTPAAFFVGFAGYGEERVFADEIKLAARVLGERYDTRDRSVLLLNDRRDLDSQPLATAASLRYTLHELAAKMDPDEDILFLSLSSHGSEGSLAVSNDPLVLHDLTDVELAAAVRDSGIKWRVIVISACHAGSFIDSLRDRTTIVITAAAADRTSFGCSDDRHLTYFGEAFYRDALPGASSLRAAFETAVDVIAERERTENIESSKPQAHFGEAIERKLAGLEGHP